MTRGNETRGYTGIRALDLLINLCIALLVGLVLGFFCFYLPFLNHVDINEFGIAYNSIGGQIWLQNTPGWYLTTPMVKVAYITTLPIKVTIPSGAQVINTKVVRFKKEGVDEYIRLQGFSYFSSEDIGNVLLGYAFSGKQYPFMEIMQEATPEMVNTSPLYRK
jgi:hypothetical protein